MATAARLRANNKYRQKTYKMVQLAYRHDEYEALKEAAEKAGEPIATFAKSAIRERMDRGY